MGSNPARRAISKAYIINNLGWNKNKTVAIGSVFRFECLKNFNMKYTKQVSTENLPIRQNFRWHVRSGVMLTCALWLFSFAAVFAACSVHKDPAGMLVLENETLRLVLDSGAGGKGASLVDLKSGVELTAWPDYGLFEDRFWVAGDRRDFGRQPYEATILTNTPDVVAVRLSALARSPGFTNLRLEKTVSLARDRHEVNIRIEFKNEGQETLPVGLWVAQNLGELGIPNTVFAPTARGVLAARHYPADPKGAGAWVGEGEGLIGQDRFLYGFTRGWMGIVSERGHGAVCLFEPEKVSCLYNWLSGSPTGVTMEWVYSKFAVVPGTSWATDFQILPFSDMSRLDGASGGATDAIAGAILWEGTADPKRAATVQATLFSGVSGTRTLTFLLQRLTDGIAETVYTEMRSVPLEKAQVHTEAFSFTPPEEGNYLLRFEVDDPQGKLLFDMETPIAIGTAPEPYEPTRNFEPQGEEMTRFRSSDVSENLVLTAPRGERGYATHTMVSDYVTPHVRWAKPLPQGPIRVLSTQGTASIREVIELDQRLDMTYTCIYQHPDESGRNPKFSSVRLMSAFEHSRWDELLQADYDLIIIGGIPWLYYSDTIRKQILRKVEQGAGLLIVAHRDSWPDPDDWLCKLHEDSEDISETFTHELPLTLLPLLQHDRLVTRAPHGQGRIIIVDYRDGTRPTRGSTLIPSYARRNEDKTPAERDGMPLNEWHYAFLTRVALATAGRSADTGVSLAALPETLTADEARTSRFSLALGSTAGTAATVRFELVDAFGERIWEQESICTVEVAANGVPVPTLGSLKRGTHVLTARVLDAQGKALDWSLRTFTVDAPLRLHALQLDKGFYRDGEVVSGSVELDRPTAPDARLELEMEIWEENGRLTGRTRIPTECLAVASASVSFRLPLTRPLWRTATLRARLLLDGTTQDELRVPFQCEPVEKEDFFFISYVPLSLEQHVEIGMNAVYDVDQAEQYNLARFLWRGAPNIYVDFKGESDSVGLIRTPCFTDPDYRDNISKTFAKTREELRDRAVLGYVFADEWKYGGRRISRPALCHSPTCLAGFREYLREHYGSIETLNRAWQTRHADFADIQPILPSETDRRLENFRAGGTVNLVEWLDHNRYIEHMLADFMGFCQNCAGDTIPIGVSGTQRTDQSAFIGWDFWQLFGHDKMRAVNLYAGAQLEIARSFAKPNQFTTLWGGGYDIEDQREKNARLRPWQLLCNGFSGVSYYFGNYSPPEFPDYTLRKQGKWIRDTTQTISKDGFARLIRSSQRIQDGIAIHYSPASLHAGRLFQLLQPSTPFLGVNYDSLIALLKASGVQFNFVSDEQIEQGELSKYSMLLLPFSHVTSEREVAAIRMFVENGGVAVADILAQPITEMLGGTSLQPLFGFATKSLPDFVPAELAFSPQHIPMPRGTAGLQPLEARPQYSFADGTPAFLIREMGQGKTVYLNFAFNEYNQVKLGGVGGEEEVVLRAGAEKRQAVEALMASLLKLAGRTSPVHVLLEESGANYSAEIARFQHGDAEYVAILRMEDPGPIRAKDRHKVKIHFGRKAHLYDCLARKYYGETDEIQYELTDGKPTLFALLPQRLERVALTTSAQTRAGKILKVEIRIPGANAGAAVLTATDQQGRERYRRILTYEDGGTQGELPFAFNDPVGLWQLIVTDVATGVQGETSLTLAAASKENE